MRGTRSTTMFWGSLFDTTTPPTGEPGFEIDAATCAALDAAGITPQPGDVVFVNTSNWPDPPIT